MGAAKRRIHRSQCFTIFTGTGSFARMEQLRRSPVRSPCDAVLFRWQPGNSGGQKFWSWYGFESRVEWCACFASWCAEQSGMVASGQVLKFSSCAVGASWFQGQGRWKGKGYTPSAGDFIFFDWNKDGQVDHVGIVVNVANGRVNTIEGNTSNMVARRSYQLGGIVIVGYGYI